MAWRVGPVDCPLAFRVNDRHIGSRPGVRQVEMLAGQPLVGKPDTAGIASGRRHPHQSLDLAGRHCHEEALQNGEIEPLMLDGECQVTCEVWRRCVPWRQNAPPPFFLDAVMFPDGRQGAWQWHLEVVGANQCRIPCRRCRVRQTPVVKNLYRP